MPRCDEARGRCDRAGNRYYVKLEEEDEGSEGKSAGWISQEHAKKVSSATDATPQPEEEDEEVSLAGGVVVSEEEEEGASLVDWAIGAGRRAHPEQTKEVPGSRKRKHPPGRIFRVPKPS